MMILMTQGGGVQNWPKVDDVIYERSLREICLQNSLPHPLVLLKNPPPRQKMKKLVKLKIS